MQPPAALRHWWTCVTALVALLAAPAALAADHWTRPAPGVSVLHRVGPGVDFHVAVVDLREPGVELVASRPSEGFATVREFARRRRAVLAFNANFFRRSSCGIAVGEGERDDAAYEHRCHASLGVGAENQAEVFDSSALLHGALPSAWMRNVVSGKPFILRDGEAPAWTAGGHMYRTHPRTAVGLDRERRRLFVLVADGRRRGVPGLDGAAMARVFRELGAWDALNLDGGGSSTFVLGDRVLNHPADGHENRVFTSVGVVLREGARWFDGEVLSLRGDAEVDPGAVGTLRALVRNTGRASWTQGSPWLPAELLEVQGAQVLEQRLEGDVAPGATGTVRLVLRGGATAGAQPLRVALRGATGAAASWALAVRRPPAAPRRRFDARSLFALRAGPEVALPEGLGAVYVGAQGCDVGPRPGAPRSLRGVLAVALCAAVVAGRRSRVRVV